MNTLGKQITRQFFQNESGFDLLQHDWSLNWENKAFREKLEPIHFFLYQAFRGKDWRKAFTPVTNTNKIEKGGYHPMQVVRDILRELRFVVDYRDPEVYMERILGPLGREVNINSLRSLMKYLPKESELLTGPTYVEDKSLDKLLHEAA